jgi:hypothetical protein
MPKFTATTEHKASRDGRTLTRIYRVLNEAGQETGRRTTKSRDYVALRVMADGKVLSAHETTEAAAKAQAANEYGHTGVTVVRIPAPGQAEDPAPAEPPAKKKPAKTEAPAKAAPEVIPPHAVAAKELGVTFVPSPKGDYSTMRVQGRSIGYANPRRKGLLLEVLNSRLADCPDKLLEGTTDRQGRTSLMVTPETLGQARALVKHAASVAGVQA